MAHGLLVIFISEIPHFDYTIRVHKTNRILPLQVTKTKDSETFRVSLKCSVIELCHEKLFMPYANNKGTDQPAHPRCLISTFVVRCLDSIIPILAKAKISNL